MHNQLMTHYPHLLEPLKLSSTTLANRIVMGSMHLGLEEAPGGFERMAEFYAERARGGVGLIITGGISPNAAGAPLPGGSVMTASTVPEHRLVTDAVHAAGGKIALQLLHFGRYAKHSDLVGASPLQAPINRLTPRELSDDEVDQTVQDYVDAAALAQTAGYDGIEIMGSEGYLINTFVAPATNQRSDRWGGSLENRMRFPLEIVRRTRATVGENFIIVFRLSMLDLVPGGSTLDETRVLARELEHAGITLLNTGIGWHESRVPTIATSVPRAAFTGVTAALKNVVGIPVITSNRINTPEVAEDLLSRGVADMVSMARPLLADPDFARKAEAGEAERINTCIGCNQACIDHTLTGLISTCLVNPRASHETLLDLSPTRYRKRIGVVGGGPAGMSAALNAAQRGHSVVLYDALEQVGGQFDLARRIPGKEEFNETLRYYRGELDRAGVTLRLGKWATVAELASENFDDVVLATGITPRKLELPGADHHKVVTYQQVLRGEVKVGRRVAIIGAGGIGFDVAEFVTQDGPSASLDVSDYYVRWGIHPEYVTPGGLTPPQPGNSSREVYLLQRKSTKVGAGLGVTTGWIHRAELAHRGVVSLSAVTYKLIDDDGLHVEIDGTTRLLKVDTIIICAGQEPRRDLYAGLVASGVSTHLIGGADEAFELDAKRAIRQGTELAGAL